MDRSQAERETRLLAEGRERILARVMKAEKAGKTQAIPYTNYLIRQALEGLAARITADNKAGAGAGSFKKFALYLGSLDPEIVALRAIQGLLEVLLQEGAADEPQPIGRKAVHRIGSAVYREYLMQHFQKLSPPLFNSLMREYNKSMTTDEAHLISAFKAKFIAEGYQFPTWKFGDTQHVGAYLLEQLRALGFVEVWNRTETKQGRANVVKYIVLAEDLRSASLELLRDVSDQPAVAAALIEPPLPWDASTNSGGGFHTPQMQTQVPYAVQRNGYRQVSPVVVASLNSLQAVGWQINAEVFDAVRATALLHSFGDIVGAHQDPAPEFRGETAEEKKAWKGEMRQWYTEKKVRGVRHLRAQRTFADAQELRGYPSIWFAYFADSRGRKYVRAGGVSPQGNDLEKGVLRFAKGKPFGSEDAVTWFLINGANKYGVDKVPLDQRVEWVAKHHEAIRAAAAEPIDSPFWREAENPVQFLAWAMEYRAWDDGGRSLSFVSHLPLGQDGTCNGLQNYGALLADPVGGGAVNLVPTDAPRDVYADVAQETTRLLEAMPPSRHRDAWLSHGINRKITKRTTMTLPYGCTRFACSQFIVEDYLEKVPVPEIAKADYGEAANFLSHVVWAAIGSTVVKAREGMDWLKGWSKHAAKAGKRVAWVAPNGLRVVSEYKKMKHREVESVAFKSRLRMYEPTDDIDTVKTANAIAPNFIHSLDASHLDMVLAAAELEGIQVAAIHDDFGTHAADTGRLHEIIREQFVLLYKDNTILKDLAASTGYEVPPPEPGDLNVDEILKSTYFFS